MIKELQQQQQHDHQQQLQERNYHTHYHPQQRRSKVIPKNPMVCLFGATLILAIGMYGYLLVQTHLEMSEFSNSYDHEDQQQYFEYGFQKMTKDLLSGELDAATTTSTSSIAATSTATTTATTADTPPSNATTTTFPSKTTIESIVRPHSTTMMTASSFLPTTPSKPSVSAAYVIFHVGPLKTGTTTLQCTLRELEQKGIFSSLSTKLLETENCRPTKLEQQQYLLEEEEILVNVPFVDTGQKDGTDYYTHHHQSKTATQSSWNKTLRGQQKQKKVIQHHNFSNYNQNNDDQVSFNGQATYTNVVAGMSWIPGCLLEWSKSPLSERSSSTILAKSIQNTTSKLSIRPSSMPNCWTTSYEQYLRQESERQWWKSNKSSNPKASARQEQQEQRRRHILVSNENLMKVAATHRQHRNDFLESLIHSIVQTSGYSGVKIVMTYRRWFEWIVSVYHERHKIDEQFKSARPAFQLWPHPQHKNKSHNDNDNNNNKRVKYNNVLFGTPFPTFVEWFFDAKVRPGSHQYVDRAISFFGPETKATSRKTGSGSSSSSPQLWWRQYIDIHVLDLHHSDYDLETNFMCHVLEPTIPGVCTNWKDSMQQQNTNNHTLDENHTSSHSKAFQNRNIPFNNSNSINNIMTNNQTIPRRRNQALGHMLWYDALALEAYFRGWIGTGNPKQRKKPLTRTYVRRKVAQRIEKDADNILRQEQEKLVSSFLQETYYSSKLFTCPSANRYEVLLQQSLVFEKRLWSYLIPQELQQPPFTKQKQQGQTEWKVRRTERHTQDFIQTMIKFCSVNATAVFVADPSWKEFFQSLGVKPKHQKSWLQKVLPAVVNVS